VPYPTPRPSTASTYSSPCKYGGDGVLVGQRDPDATAADRQGGGTLSGEHGDGQQRTEFLVKQYGPELVDAFREFKRIWDPDFKMNPGKVIDPFPIDSNLKLGSDSNPPRPPVKFAYKQDGGDFAHAALRCAASASASAGFPRPS